MVTRSKSRPGSRGNLGGSARGTVGLVKPTLRPGSPEDLIRMLPAEIGVIQTQVNIRSGSREELDQALKDYEGEVRALSARGVDLVHVAGVPPLLLGYAGERKLVRRWEQEHGTPVFTNGMSQVNALKAFRAKRVIAASYFPGAINDSFSRYIEEAGFEVLEIQGMDVAFDRVQTVASTEVYAFIRRIFLRNPSADAIYIIGPGWPTLDIIEPMEQDWGIPVIHHIPAQSWEIQRRLHVREPVAGFGRLVREMPPLPTRA